MVKQPQFYFLKCLPALLFIARMFNPNLKCKFPAILLPFINVCHLAFLTRLCQQHILYSIHGVHCPKRSKQLHEIYDMTVSHIMTLYLLLYILQCMTCYTMKPFRTSYSMISEFSSTLTYFQEQKFTKFKFFFLLFTKF
jgi:hypothetical protein